MKKLALFALLTSATFAMQHEFFTNNIFIVKSETTITETSTVEEKLPLNNLIKKEFPRTVALYVENTLLSSSSTEIKEDKEVGTREEGDILADVAGLFSDIKKSFTNGSSNYEGRPDRITEYQELELFEDTTYVVSLLVDGTDNIFKYNIYTVNSEEELAQFEGNPFNLIFKFDLNKHSLYIVNKDAWMSLDDSLKVKLKNTQFVLKNVDDISFR